MLRDLKNIKRKLNKITFSNIKDGIKSIGVGILSLIGFVVLSIIEAIGGVIVIFKFLVPFIAILAFIVGIGQILFSGYRKSRFKKELNKKVQEYNISIDILEEIDREFGKTDEEVIVACGYLINIKGKIIKVDEIGYVNLEARIKEKSELKIDICLKNRRIEDSFFMEVPIELARDVAENKEEIDFGDVFVGKLKEVDIEIKLIN